MPSCSGHIKSTTKAQQGLYEYDVASRCGIRSSVTNASRNIHNYIVKGVLWQATADEQVVLLIDEIDKADIEFPKRLAARTRPDGILRLRNPRDGQGQAPAPGHHHIEQ
jgi:hypothetical protein